MKAQYLNQTMALAGVFQSADLVTTLAETGQISDFFFKSSLQTILETNPVSTEAVYGDVANIRLGLESLLFALENKYLKKNKIHCTINILMAYKKLKARPELLALLGSRIPRIGQQVTHFDLLHENVLAAFASLYADTLSQLTFRIHISGKPEYLKPACQIDKVRSILLAGIRSAALWEQQGGRLYQLIFFKKRLKECTRYLLAKLPPVAV